MVFIVYVYVSPSCRKICCCAACRRRENKDPNDDDADYPLSPTQNDTDTMSTTSNSVSSSITVNTTVANENTVTFTLLEHFIYITINEIEKTHTISLFFVFVVYITEQYHNFSYSFTKQQSQQQ